MRNALFVVCLIAKYPQWVAMYDGDKTFYFDGLKDMMKYAFARKLSNDKFYVSDYYKLSKLEASKAFYVLGSNVYGLWAMNLFRLQPKKRSLELFTRPQRSKGHLL